MGKWGKEEGAGVKLWNITNHQEQGAPVCNSPADRMDRQTEICLYSLPSVLETFHWCNSAWSALLCSPITVLGSVVAWEVPGRCVTSSCWYSQRLLWLVLPACAAKWRACLHTSGLPTIFYSWMDLPVISCSGHCHLFGRFICSPCSYSYHEKSLDQGPWFYYVFVNHLAGWVSNSILGPRESTAFPGMPVIHCMANPFLTLCSGKNVSPCLTWEQDLFQSCLYFHQMYYCSFTLLMWCSYNVQPFVELNICCKHLHANLWKNLNVSWVR